MRQVGKAMYNVYDMSTDEIFIPALKEAYKPSIVAHNIIRQKIGKMDNLTELRYCMVSILSKSTGSRD